jgi:23S rRNA (guanosine2251-2'-O)-methyltransferase
MSDLIYGRRAVLETLRAARRRIYRLWIEGEPKSGDALSEILALAESQNVSVRNIQGGLFEKLQRQNTNPQGVALEVGDYPYVAVEEILQLARDRNEAPFILILDHLQDPQNIGTLFRTAEAMGVHGVILPDRRAARITAAASNASAGAVELLLVAQVTNINRVITDLKEHNIWSVGLDGSPEVPAITPKALTGSIALVIGSEGAGLSRLTRETCDLLVRLPMSGRVESLNAAVAGSIALYLAAQSRIDNST